MARGRRARRWIFVLLIGSATVSCCSGSVTLASAHFFTDEAIRDIAPVVVFHHSEDFHPTSGKAFLDHAGLAWSHNDHCAPVYHHYRFLHGHGQAWTDAEIAKLGSGGFVERLRSPKSDGCKSLRGDANAFDTTALTRPRQKGRNPKLGSAEGWFLDLADSDRAGFPDEVPGDSQYETRAPTYYDDGLLYVDGKRSGYAFITYWFFYAYDDGLSWQNHEGDWENVSVKLRSEGGGRWKPVQVYYAKHGDSRGPDEVSWDRAFKVKSTGNTRLQVFSALGTHGTYGSGFDPSKYLDRIDEDGPTWDTRRSLRFLWDQGWAGYCGAWGRIGRISDTTGPLGPGCRDARGNPVKRGFPSSWGLSAPASEEPTGNGLTLPLTPPPDADGDGVPDSSDACPNSAGTRADGCPNPAPTANSQEFTFAVNGGPNHVTYAKRLSASDDTAIAAWVLDYQSFGTASQNFHWGADGSFSMKPEAPAGATLTFRYHVTDNENAPSGQATVTIHVCQNATAYPCPP